MFSVFDIKFLLFQILYFGVILSLLENLLGSQPLRSEFVLELFSLVLHLDGTLLLGVEGLGLGRKLRRWQVLALSIDDASVLGSRRSLVGTGRWGGSNRIAALVIHHDVQIWLLRQRRLNCIVKLRIVLIFRWDLLCLRIRSWPFCV